MCAVPQDGCELCLQACSGLVLQLLQATAELPASDACMNDVLNCSTITGQWADRFWAGIMER